MNKYNNSPTTSRGGEKVVLGLNHKIIVSRPEHQNNVALFLDRDGVLIEDMHYLKDPNQVILIEGAIELLREAKKRGLVTIIISNQSGVGRGYYNWNDYEAVTMKMLSLFGESELISAMYASGAQPETDIEIYRKWRKPEIGMIKAAKADLSIDLNKSFLIGDRITDIKAGWEAKLNTLYHVKTGKGRIEHDAVVNFKESSSKEGYNPIIHTVDSVSNVILTSERGDK